LYQWNTTYNDEHEVKGQTKSGDPWVNFKITYSSEKIGTNIMPEEIYAKVIDEPHLCDDYGKFYDRKTDKCINFADVTNIEDDIEINEIDVAYSHNYGIAFWIFFENYNDIINPINIIWKYHMQISLEYKYSSRSMKAYCFPQNYEPYSKIIGKTDLSLENKALQVLNSVTNEYTDDLSGKWSWFQCSLTYNNRYFYLNENKQTLITETLYKEGTTEFKNDEPLGFFYNGISNSYSTLRIETTRNNDNPDRHNVYIRCLYLFKDYLPYNYNFKYMDMYKIDSKQFPPLVFAMNFAEFDFGTSSNGYIRIKYNKFNTTNNQIARTDVPVALINNTKQKLKLSANFVFLPLCNPITKEKYNSETNLCQEIENCDYTALNALYCMDEATPLVCKKNYYINIQSITNKAYCSNYCEDNKFFRSPGTTENQGICGTDCLHSTVLKTCPNSASSILTYQDKFECNACYNRIGYQCLRESTRDAPNEGDLFYSGVNYPYNIVHTLYLNLIL
jgi:hypothetical protein